MRFFLHWGDKDRTVRLQALNGLRSTTYSTFLGLLKAHICENQQCTQGLRNTYVLMLFMDTM